MERWKELEQCHDFEVLRENFSDEMLDYFEEEINYYLYDITEEEFNENGVSIIVLWYTGNIETKDLLFEYSMLTK